MKCPACGFENLEGVDRCEECMASFLKLDIPQPKEGLQAHIMLDPVRNVYSPNPAVVSSVDSLGRAVEIMRRRHAGCVLVVDGGQLTGILSEADLFFRFGPQGGDLQQSKVAEFMTPNPEVLEEDSTIAIALHAMSIGGYRHLPVMRGSNVVGIVSVKDIIRYLKENLP